MGAGRSTPWSRLRGWVALVGLALVTIARPARAEVDAVTSPDLTVLTPPKLPPSRPQAATLRPPALPAHLLGQPLDVLAAVVDQGPFRDVKAPILTSARRGDRVTPELARTVLREALESGLFADGRVELFATDHGVRVLVRLVPRKLVEAVRIDMGRSTLDEQLLLQDIELTTGSELVASELELHETRLAAILARRGFPAAKVEIATRPTDDPMRVVVIVGVDLGAPRRIERRVLYPMVTMPPADVKRLTKYGARVGDRADEEVLDQADRDLQTTLRGVGWHQARVTHDVVLYHGVVMLRVRVDPGVRYETRYEGNDHFDATTLDEALDLEAETDRSEAHLIEKLQRYYTSFGFLDAEIQLEDRGAPGDGVHFLVFHIRERARVHVAVREYPCLKTAQIEKLGRAPTSASGIGSEIDSFLEEELPDAEIVGAPRPAGVDRVIASSERTGSRPAPLELEPRTVYAPQTYDRAVEHVQDLYRSEGFLSALVGPVQVVRRRCNPRSAPGTCEAMPLPSAPVELCRYDRGGTPLPPPALDAAETCVPDPEHGVECEPVVRLRIPVKLGPRSQLYDVAFSGTHAFSPRALAKIAELKLGSYVSTAEIDEARRRILEHYREAGYAFADVRYELEPSQDKTRARVRFTVSESELVTVRQIVVRGNVYTTLGAIERRIALEVGGPYRASLVRKTQERIATLNTFSSVTVALENPYVPQATKVVVITVAERPRQYTELAPGFSTGEGFRLTTEYGHRNLAGAGIALTLRLQLAHLPTPFIIDPVARENYDKLNLDARIATRGTASLVFPDVGLGPLVKTGLDGILVHSLQRDFYITKFAAVPSITYRPATQFSITFSQSAEFNNVRIFREGNATEYLISQIQQGRSITDLARQLNLPDGESFALAQRLVAAWDRRDNAFNARRGTYLVSSIEHVDAYPRGDRASNTGTLSQTSGESHFIKLSETFGGYIPLPRGMRIASLTNVGMNVQLTRDSVTYPDRFFFLGGVDSMRGWFLNAFVPQDDADRIEADRYKTVADPNDPTLQIPDPSRFTVATRPVHGGNFVMVERLELRIPVKGIFETVAFSDIGNLWVDPYYPFRRGEFPIRANVGTGLRIQTPVGPFAIDYGVNVTRRFYEDFGALNFAIGLF